MPDHIRNNILVIDLDTGIPFKLPPISDRELERVVDSESYCVIDLHQWATLCSDSEDPIAEGRIQSDGSIVVIDKG